MTEGTSNSDSAVTVKEITWKNLIKNLATNKTCWVIILGTLALLLAYFSPVFLNQLKLNPDLPKKRVTVKQKFFITQAGKQVEKTFTRQEVYTPIEAFKTAFKGVLYFILPLIVALILRIKIRNLGLGFGDFKHWVPITSLFLVVMLPVVWLAAHSDSFKNAYPSDYFARYDKTVFAITALSYLIYFIGWEFIFRGFFLLSLREKLGDAVAITVQMIPFAAMHINKPAPEAISSILGGLILGLLVIRVRSFWPCVIIHWVVHTSINYFVCILHYW